MSETKQVLINFLLSGIRTEQFAIIESAYNTGSENEMLSTSLRFGCEPETKRVAVDFRFDFEQQKGRPFLIIEVETVFTIEDSSWEEMKQNKTIVMPQNFAAHLAALSIGNVRGVLHARTEQTTFRNIQIPLFNVQEFTPEDVIIDI